MFGVFLDVTERKLAEEARELLAGEMGHRVKNLFSIACELTAISARSTQTKAEMSRDLTQRLTALSIAHDLVRPVLSEPKKAARLKGRRTIRPKSHAKRKSRSYQGYAQTLVCARNRRERQNQGTFLSKPSFRMRPKGNRISKGS